ATGAFHFRAVVADEVDRFLHLPHGFDTRLATYDQASDRNLPFALFKGFSACAQNLNTPFPACVAPAGIGSPCSPNSLVDQRLFGLGELTKNDVTVDWTSRDDHLALRPIAA